MFVYFFISSANAITCYSCSNSKDCNDELNPGSSDVSTLDSSEDCIYCTKKTYIDHGAGKPFEQEQVIIAHERVLCQLTLCLRFTQ